MVSFVSLQSCPCRFECLTHPHLMSPTGFQGHLAQLYRTLHLQHPTSHLYHHHHHQGQCLSFYLKGILCNPHVGTNLGTLQLSRTPTQTRELIPALKPVPVVRVWVCRRYGYGSYLQYPRITPSPNHVDVWYALSHQPWLPQSLRKRVFIQYPNLRQYKQLMLGINSKYTCRKYQFTHLIQCT